MNSDNIGKIVTIILFIIVIFILGGMGMYAEQSGQTFMEVFNNFMEKI